jgi:hypothetical protein
MECLLYEDEGTALSKFGSMTDRFAMSNSTVLSVVQCWNIFFGDLGQPTMFQFMSSFVGRTFSYFWQLFCSVVLLQSTLPWDVSG